MSTEATCCCASSKELSPMEEARAIVESRMGSEAWQKIDQLGEEIAKHPAAFYELPLNHVFANGLYLRECFMKKGDLILTRVHMVEHVYLVISGEALVWSDDAGWVKVQGYCSGVTKPGTRRIILILEDMLWATVHPNPNNETDPDKIIKEVTFDHFKMRLKNEVAA